MSCTDCSEAQKQDVTFYYRWKNAVVEIRACSAHLKEMFAVLNAAQHASVPGPAPRGKGPAT